ncbi:DUF378 domain-containing protein [Candidatus Falkowbacteria bacterium]|nr:DUF378 domain-containing protein [Candidatus Falkowbacteria bacterium]
MKALNAIALILVIIGGLNWGLIGFFNFNLVTTIFGDLSILSRVVYSLVGLSALVLAVGYPKLTK